MKKTVYIFIAIAIIFTFSSHSYAAKLPPKCDYARTGKSYNPTRVYYQYTATFNIYPLIECVVDYTTGAVRYGNDAILQDDMDIPDKNGTHVYVGDHFTDPGTGLSLTLTYKNDDFWGTGYYLMTADGTQGYGLYNNYARTIIKNGVVNPTVTLLSTAKTLVGSATPTIPLDDPSLALFLPWAQGFRTPPPWEDVSGIGWQDMFGRYISDGDTLTKDTGGPDIYGNPITATGPDLTVIRGIYGLNDLYLYNAATHLIYPYYWKIPDHFSAFISKDHTQYDATNAYFRSYKIKSSIQ